MGILVTGGAGYIGSHFVYKLIEKGYDVIVIDNLDTGFKEAIHREVSFYKGDIRDLKFLDLVFSRESIECVVHFAANSLVGESMENPLKYFDNNVYGMQNLLKSMVKHNIDKIVFSSTAATYGEPNSTLITEEHITHPINVYGESKLMMEKLMYWTKEAHGLKYIALRYFNVAGAHKSGMIGESHMPETHLIPIILQVALGIRDYITVFGNDYPTEDGTCIRDYIHINDLVDAHILSMEKLLNGKYGGTYNLGTGKGYSIMEMIESARNVTGHLIPSQIGQRRVGDPAVLVASNNLAKVELGWSPKHMDIGEIIQSAWKFHQKYPKGFNRGDDNGNI